MPGKVIGRRTYLHVETLAALDEARREAWEQAVRQAELAAGLERGERFNVLRLDADGQVALLHYPHFFDDPFPALRESWRFEPSTGEIGYRTYADSLNPPILHRKELLLPSDHPRHDEYVALTAAAEAIGLFEDSTRIGYQRQWLALVREKGYRIDGHALLPLGNLDVDEVETAADDGAPLHAGWEAARQRTAMVRYGFSAPIQSFHIGSGKLTLMRFDDFEGQALPRLLERVKIKMRDQDVDLFGYGEQFEPPFLYRKSRYINEEFPGYPQQLAFDDTLEQLAAKGLFSLAGYGPPAMELTAILARHHWQLDGLRLRRLQTIPALDDACGRFLTFRQLIECGETWQRLRAAGEFDNRPQRADSYRALLELAEQVLDPVIDWFGMIRLTYGFCSPALARQIPGRIDPKRDQHAAHERNRLGNLICPRLGAAVDFIIEDEDMREVAEWVAANTPFDRLYFYGADQPIHVSYGPEDSRQIVTMSPGPSGRLLPRSLSVNAFLER
ncbi:hypothetical protein [Halochromatium roseum]|uniref:hypothetical protein n=1 Tax=Halochromatium roseum TaxID=391920 RepID=UPI001F5CEFBA|nr:hypothetical protein [Halochromatium roseum]